MLKEAYAGVYATRRIGRSRARARIATVGAICSGTITRVRATRGIISATTVSVVARVLINIGSGFIESAPDGTKPSFESAIRILFQHSEFLRQMF